MDAVALIHQYYEERFSPADLDISDVPCLVNQVLPTTPAMQDSEKGHYYFTTNNIGKDIGGKLFLFHCIRSLGFKPQYVLLVHDKKSPQVNNGLQWRQDLLRITDRTLRKEIMTKLARPEVGIVCSREALMDEAHANRQTLLAKNEGRVRDMMDNLDLHPPSLSYVGGTMFWAKYAPFEDFFTRHSPLQLRSALEPGNVLDLVKGSETHAFERIFTYIVTSVYPRIETV